MQIALICQNYPPSLREGGVSHYTQRLAQSLCKMGDNVFIITGEGYLGNGSDGNITIIKFRGKWGKQTVREMTIKLKSLSIDTINLQYTPSMYSESFKFAWRYLAKRFVSTISFHTLWGGFKLNYLVAISLLQSSDGIIATNSEITYLLKKYFRIFLKKVKFIPIGPNIELTQESTCAEKILKKYSLTSEGKIIAYFGMAYPGKGISLLLESMEILTKSHELDIKLLIIGGGLSQSESYIIEKKWLANKLGITNRITWTGKIEENEVSDILTLSDLVVLPFSSGVSDRRGSILTALAHYKAVITTKPKIPIPDFINGDNMIWIDKNDPNELAQAIYRVLMNDNLKVKLENGAAELIKKFRWKEIGKQTHSFHKNLIS
jgi:glycosyltransferase involved in cell wall biosynthesis